MRKVIELENLRYAPDADYTRPDVYYSVTNMIPTMRGSYKPAYALAASGYPALLVAPLSGSILKRADGSVGLYAGGVTAVYEANGAGVWTNISKAGGYTGTATSWQFAVYGNVTIATNYVDNPQFHTGTGIQLADLTGAPKAKCVAVMANAVLLFNYNDGVNVYADGWYASDVGNYAQWVAAASNTVANGRLTDTPGPITAAATLNETVIVWKNRGMYIGRFVGDSTEWTWQLLSADIGCVAPDAWVHTDVGIVFASERDIFLYDGGSIRPIGGTDIRTTLFSGATYDNQSYIKLTYEPSESLVYVFVNTSGSTSGCNRAFVWNHQSGKWGNAGRGLGVFGNTTYAYVKAVFRNPNYADLLSRGFSSNTTRCAAAVMDSTGLVAVFSGAVSSYTAGQTCSTVGPVTGRAESLSTLVRVVPKFLGTPPTGTDVLSINYDTNSIAVLASTSSGTWDATRYRFNALQTGKYFQLTHTTTGEVSGYQYQYEDAGRE